MGPWATHSEIVHYIAEKPEGPFHFADLAMACAPDTPWNNSLHNPAIARVGYTYVLLYVTFDRISADRGMKIGEKSPSVPP
jgi:hypothetical protein